MFFTQEDYKKIQQWLTKNSVKDTEFNEANIPFNGEETITIVQGNQNKKVFLKDLIAQVFNLGISDFVNITDKYDAPNISLEEAIRLIPSRARKEGQVITFLDKEDHWHIYQFKGVLNQWNVLDTWEDLFDWENLIIDSILPDEEDLTKSEPDANGNSYLSLKDREYNPEDFSGLGRVIIRKNIVEVEDPIYGKVKKNLLYQDMFTQSNTIYEIRYDFNLGGKEITIPEGCVLDFQGGSLSNGIVIGYNTVIRADLVKIFNTDIILRGSWNVANANPEWFDVGDDVRDKLILLTRKETNNIISSGGSVGGKPLYGTYSNACSLCVDPDGREAGILGLDNREIMASYAGRDMVGQYIGMRSPIETIVTGSNFTKNSVTLSSLPDFICAGMILDVLGSDNNNWTKYSGIITAVDRNTKIVNVEYWVKVGNSSVGQVPTYTQENNVRINPCTKIWGLNINILLNNERSAYNGVIGEYGIWNARTKQPSYSGGHDTVLFNGSCQFGYRARCDSSEDKSKMDAGFYDMLNTVGFLADRSTTAFKADGFTDFGVNLKGHQDSKAIGVYDNINEHYKYLVNGRGFVESSINLPNKVEEENQQINILGQDVYIPSNISSFTLPESPVNYMRYHIYTTGDKRDITINGGNNPIWMIDSFGKQVQAYSVVVNISATYAVIYYQDAKWYLFCTPTNNNSNEIKQENQQINPLGQDIYIPSDISSFTLPNNPTNHIKYYIHCVGRRRNITINGGGSPIITIDSSGREVQKNSITVDLSYNNAFIYYQDVKWFLFYTPNNNATGSTPERPIGSDINVGFQYFDTTLSKPIWWTGEKWVDATGADV